MCFPIANAYTVRVHSLGFASGNPDEDALAVRNFLSLGTLELGTPGNWDHILSQVGTLQFPPLKIIVWLKARLTS